ncbi:hypothetical protein KW795_01035, partial [Candidatus Microgenomates bacterium]|nr:hypothetical protein [Candidatus Microgenomates bacterium]
MLKNIKKLKLIHFLASILFVVWFLDFGIPFYTIFKYFIETYSSSFTLTNIPDSILVVFMFLIFPLTFGMFSYPFYIPLIFIVISSAALSYISIKIKSNFLELFIYSILLNFSFVGLLSLFRVGECVEIDCLDGQYYYQSMYIYYIFIIPLIIFP